METLRVLVRVPEAAQMLGIGRTKLYELIQLGDIPMVHIGRGVRIPVQALEAYAQRLQQEQGV